MDFLRSITRSVSTLALALGLVAVALVTPASAANICDPTVGTQCQRVTTSGAAEIIRGKSVRPTYSVSFGALGAAAAHTVSIESSAGTGFRLTRWCISVSNATAASSVNVVVQRRTTASSGGTAATNEGTGTSVVSKFDPADGSYGGIARLDGTPGTAGAVLDQQNIQVGIIATGAGSEPGFCREYGTEGDKTPIAAAGVANGISIAVPSFGAGSLATSITAIIIAEN